MRILVLGASGMLGNAMLRVMTESGSHEVWGTARSAHVGAHFSPDSAKRILTVVDIENADSLLQLFQKVRPDAVINCVGIIKQLAEADNPLSVLPINSILPHRIASICSLIGARLIHISTDCVFSGSKGNYRETDKSDAEDLYGRSKYLGEVTYPHTITLRTSIIGHELGSWHGLLGWFLRQEGHIKGYRRAIFSGLPTVELSRIIRDFVLPDRALSGLYHVSAAPISKFDLLTLIAEIYGRPTRIDPEESTVIDRSLDSSRFQLATGYVPPPWPELIARMRQFK